MACCTITQQQRQLRLRPSRGSSFVLAAPMLLVLLLLAVFAQPSSCRPLPLADESHHNNGAVVVKVAAATDVILLPLPADAETKTKTIVVAAPSSVPREEDDEDRRHRLAGGRYEWLLNKKPRQKAPPSAPSKRTN